MVAVLMRMQSAVLGLFTAVLKIIPFVTLKMDFAFRFESITSYFRNKFEYRAYRYLIFHTK